LANEIAPDQIATSCESVNHFIEGDPRLIELLKSGLLDRFVDDRKVLKA
jgi:hypothetical protein